MSYIDRHLMAGESVQFRTKLHWNLYVMPSLAVLVVCAPLAFWAANSERKELALIPVAAAFVILGVAWIKRRSSEFAVTNKRVIIKLGVLSIRSVELLLAKVEGIEVTQGLLGRLFGYGQIVVIGSGGTREPFPDIQSPLEFRLAVQAATDARFAGRPDAIPPPL